MNEQETRRELLEAEAKLSRAKRDAERLQSRRDELLLRLADSDGCNSRRGIPR